VHGLILRLNEAVSDRGNLKRSNGEFISPISWILLIFLLLMNLLLILNEVPGVLVLLLSFFTLAPMHYCIWGTVWVQLITIKRLSFFLVSHSHNHYLLKNSGSNRELRHLEMDICVQTSQKLKTTLLPVLLLPWCQYAGDLN
jgi:hypothetical protein